MQYWTLLISLIVLAVPYSGAQIPESSAPATISLPIKLVAYSFAMKIANANQITGYYTEKLAATEQGWELTTVRLSVQANGYYKRDEQWRITCDKELRMQSFYRTIQTPTEEYWSEGEVKETQIKVNDSKSSSRTFDFPATAIPSPLLLLYFLKQKEKQLLCQEISLVSGKFTLSQVKMNEQKQVKNRFRKTIAEAVNPVAEETQDTVTVAVIEEQAMQVPPAGGTPQPAANSPATIYHIALAGEQVSPGICTMQQKEDSRYTWIRRQQYNEGLSLSRLTPKKDYNLAETMANLKTYTEQLKSEDVKVRTNALQQIIAIGLIYIAPSLIEALKDQDPNIKAQAVQTLRSLTGKTYEEIEQWQLWWRIEGPKIMKNMPKQQSGVKK
jgi:hypothetical protein